MLFLPEVRAADQCWRLPVSGAAAAHLFRGLLSDRDSARLDAYCSALQGEPSLALWVACRAGTAFGGRSTLRDAAEWLSRHAAALDGSAAVEAEEAAAAVGDWAELSAGTVSSPIQRASSPTDPLGSLLRGAPLWLARVGPPVEVPSRLGCLPGWLASWLAQGNLLLEPIRSGNEADTIRERWFPSDGDTALAAALPRLAATAARLEALEADFQQTLAREKMAALRELAYGASHEINNPLANISTRAQALLRGEEDPERRRRLATIAAQAFRAHEMIADMMLFAKPPGLELVVVDVATLIPEVVGELAHQAEQQGTKLICEVGWSGTLRADPDHLAVAIQSLVRNALEALDVGGRVEVTCCGGESCAGLGADVVISVADTGPGIPAAARDHLFDPFFSGREAGRGLGMGLSKCWRIVSLHGGSLEAENVEGGGARFTIRLPEKGAACPTTPSAG